MNVHPRSTGVKLIIVSGLAVSMAIPGLFVAGLIEERTQRASEVVRQISGYSGGPQVFLGPCLVAPYRAPFAAGSVSGGSYIVFPVTASAKLQTATEERRRSLFKVPVFRAEFTFDATFDFSATPSGGPAGSELDWSRAEMVVGVTNARGALEEATLTAEGKTMVLGPARVLPDLTIGTEPASRIRLTLLGTQTELGKPGSTVRVTSSLHFSGAQRVAVLAYGKTTHLSAQGDWPSPGFDGGFLPVSRSITRNGYTAEWSIPFIARGVHAEGPTGSIGGLEATALGISFIEVADPYQSVNRCLKYVLLFVSLVFVSYFVLEVSTGKRIHPAQYVLVGVAQTIFYLLLLSLAERLGFDWAFLFAGGATVTLLSANAGWVFASGLQGIRASITFTLLYTLIYLMLRSEDNALLIGSIASFLAVAAAMYFTRRIDWYTARPAADNTLPGSAGAVRP